MQNEQNSRNNENESQKKKFLILGGAGFIGSKVSQLLLDDGHEVIIYDRFFNFLESEKDNYIFYLKKRLGSLHGKITIICGDVRDTAKLTEIIKKQQPNIVIHLAQIPLATISNQISSEAIDINLNGMVSLIKSIGNVGIVERIVYSSSSFVYGHFQYLPADEKHPTNPIDVYGGTKLACENILKGFGTRFNIEYTIIRPSAVYGPRDVNKRVSQIFVESAFNGKELVLEGGENNTLDFTYIDDVVQGFIKAALSPNAKNEILNITQGVGRTLKEYADILKIYFPNIKMSIKPADPNRPKRGALDISKARQLIGFDPQFPLERGLKEYVAYLKKIIEEEPERVIKKI